MIPTPKSTFDILSIAFPREFFSFAILVVIGFVAFPVSMANADTWYVDFTNGNYEDGTSVNPFNTLAEALNLAADGEIISITGSDSHETPTIARPITLTSSSGTVVIGDLNSDNGSGSDYEQLKITEIMYNPASGKAEFLELQNISSRTIDVTDCYFSDGVDFTFPASSTLTAGEYITLVRDSDEGVFISDYSFTPFGVYAGNLDNGGERLAINNPSDFTFLDLTYNDGASWPDLADGVGFSLVIIDPQGDGSDSSNWRASNADGGNPGEVDIDPNTPGIVVNEILSHTDEGVDEWIELYNPTGSTVDVSGWFLSDDRKTPFKAKIPASTTIPAGGYVTFDETFFDAAPGLVGATPLPGFLMSSHGEDIFLFASDGSDNLTGYAHGWGFGGSENGVSFGRIITSDGREHFVAQTSTTKGSANAGPSVGPLVVSRVHYHPLSNGVEYVEITNISGNTVNLYDDTSETDSDPNNTYKISGIGYEFPTGQSIAAGDVILIVNTDPSIYTSRFGTPTGIAAIYGPFGNDPGSSSDALSNGGETVQINWPDVPDEIPLSSGNFVASYISMDKVRYNDKAPWPIQPDGTGVALDRVVDGDFGSEPTNWTHSVPGHQPEFQVSDLLFSTKRGFYDTDFNLTISTATASSTIYYTTDGTLPDATDTEYIGPISITANSAIRATAIRSGYIDALTETHTYIMHAPDHEKGVRAIAVVGDPGESLYNPNGVMAINNGAYFPALFDTLEWGPYTYNTSASPLDNPNTGEVDTWLDPLGNPVYPLVGATGDPYDSPKTGATLDGTAYNNPVITGRAMERPASLELLYPDGTAGLQENAGIRVAGSDFHRPRYAAFGDGSGDWTAPLATSIPEATLASYLKFSLRMYFRSEYGATKLTWPIYPGDTLFDYDKLVLRGGHNDGHVPFIKDELTRRLFRDMGNVGVQGTLVNLYINGDYKGWYNPCERLDEKFFQARYGGSSDYDILTQTLDLGGEINDGYFGLGYTPQVKEGDDTVFQALIAAAQTNADTPSSVNYDAIAELLDIPQFIDYLLVQIYAGNDDWPNNNWTAARERVEGGKFRFYVWDAEGTYLPSNLNRNGIEHFPFWNDTWQVGGAGLNVEFTPVAEIYRGLMASQTFKDAFSTRAVEVFTDTTGALSDENVTARHDELKSEMEALLPAGTSYNNHISTNWIPSREAYIIGVLQSEGLYPNP